jgi:catechol 2,3-dioxygenase-like lactoylglutathione lyase family enzyme
VSGVNGSGVTRLRSIAVSAPEPSALLPFYEQTWGLRPAGVEPDGTVLLRAAGPEHHVLALVPGPGRTLERIGLAAADRVAIDELTERARSAGTPVLDEPGERPSAGGGYGVVLADPEGRAVEIAAGTAEQEVLTGIAGPDRLSHAVLNCVDLAASARFYTEVLGFRVSDRYERDQMVFLRCNEKHHCLVLAPGRWSSLNHVAFEVASADEVMKALGRMRAAGVETIWGPGRHGPGGNVFCYFTDPVGTVIEYTAELLEVDDTWEPSVWARTPENADVWGTSGGITPEVVAAMANPPVGARR